MYPRQLAPWNELLRACAARELDASVFGIRIVLTTDRLEPRTVGITLSSGSRSVDLAACYLCPCGAFAVGQRGAELIVDDLASATGAAKYVDFLIVAMRQARSELRRAPEPLLRTVAADLHAEVVRQIAVHATRWNLPPYALMGRSRARPAKCVHAE